MGFQINLNEQIRVREGVGILLDFCFRYYLYDDCYFF